MNCKFFNFKALRTLAWNPMHELVTRLKDLSSYQWVAHVLLRLVIKHIIEDVVWRTQRRLERWKEIQEVANWKGTNPTTMGLPRESLIYIFYFL